MNPNTKPNSTVIPETLVQVHFPSQVDVELVQANEVRHYEIFFALFSLLLSLACTFWTALFIAGSANGSGALLASALAFTALTALFLFLGLRSRSRVYSKTIKKTAPLTAFRAEEMKLLSPGQQIRESRRKIPASEILKTRKNTLG